MNKQQVIDQCVEQCIKWCEDDSESNFLAIELFDYMNDLMLAWTRKTLAEGSLPVEQMLEHYSNIVLGCKEWFTDEWIEECIPISITPEVHDVAWERGSASGIHSFGTEYHGVYEAVEKCYDFIMDFYKNLVVEEMVEL